MTKIEEDEKQSEHKADERLKDGQRSNRFEFFDVENIDERRKQERSRAQPDKVDVKPDPQPPANEAAEMRRIQALAKAHVKRHCAERNKDRGCKAHRDLQAASSVICDCVAH